MPERLLQINVRFDLAIHQHLGLALVRAATGDPFDLGKGKIRFEGERARSGLAIARSRNTRNTRNTRIEYVLAESRQVVSGIGQRRCLADPGIVLDVITLIPKQWILDGHVDDDAVCAAMSISNLHDERIQADIVEESPSV